MVRFTLLGNGVILSKGLLSSYDNERVSATASTGNTYFVCLERILEIVTRIALIGTGNIAGSHLKAIKAAGERAELVAAVDVSEERLSAFCAENDIPHQYTSAAAMLATEQPDLVLIATPPATHIALILECLEAGAWVLCEKPLVGSLADFDSITAVEERTGRYVSTVFQWRFGSAGKHLKSLIGQNALGRPLVGVCNTLWYRNDAYFDVAWRGKWATELGGPTMGHGIHLTDLFLWLMGDWAEISAMMGTLERKIEFEDVAMALVRFESGALGSVVNSVLSPRQESHLRLDFQKATVEVNALYSYRNENWRFTALDADGGAATVAQWDALRQDIGSSHAEQLKDVLDSLDKGERPPVSGGEARRILEFIASLYKSAMTGETVQRGSITLDDPFYYAMNGAAQGKKS